MKKILALCLSAMLLLSGCGNAKTDTNKLSIVSLSFPGYSFAKEIAGENAEVSLLLPVGSEVHSYEPTPKDIIKIQSCDLFIYGGGESEAWVDEVLASADSKIPSIAMTKCVELLDEEITEGMESEEEELEKDEHVWTSVKNASVICEKICDKICEKDGKNADFYRKNLEKYQKKLGELDEKFSELSEKAEKKEIVVGDRFPFRYLAHDLSLTYYAAFPGCAGESEPSASTVAFLIDKVKEDKIPVVFYTEFSNMKVADTICEETGAKKALLHSCHNVTKEEFTKGESYLSLMEGNLSALKEALNVSD